MRTAYLAADGFQDQLAAELHYARVAIAERHGNLFLTEADAINAAWSLNTWRATERIEVTSVGNAAEALRARQRNWCALAVSHRGRCGLIVDKLPYIAAKPLALGQPAPASPLGSFTLLTPTLRLAAASCTSPFPNGQPTFVVDHDGPPNRAYLKLWEALALLRAAPVAGAQVLDLGASPGGWTWSLARLGAQVTAVDRAPLDDQVMAMPNVRWRGESAFGMDPRAHTDVDWVFSDIIAYPNKILALAQRWIAAHPTVTLVFTIKLQGPTDFGVIDEFRQLPDARVVHLSTNKNELTLLRRASQSS